MQRSRPSPSVPTNSADGVVRAQSALTRIFSLDPVVAMLTQAASSVGSVAVSGTAGAARSMLAAELAERLQQPVLLALENESDTAAVVGDLNLLYPHVRHLAFDPADALSASELSGLPGTAGAVVVTTQAGLAARAPQPAPRNRIILALRPGDPKPVPELLGWLETAGYEHVDLVTEPGEYATRGCIVDVFPTDEELPVRIEMSDDVIASLRRFNPLSQRSVAPAASTGIRTLKPPPPSDRPAASLLPETTLLVSEAPIPGFTRYVMLAYDTRAEFDLGCTQAPSYYGNLRLLRSEIEATPLRRFIACGTAEARARLQPLLGSEPDYIVGSVSAGFQNDDSGYALLTERELYGRALRRRVRHRFRGLPVDSLVTLRPGDHVVHVQYGIGVFEETRRMAHAGFDKDFIVLRYADRARVYVPVENLGLLDRYIGAKDVPVQLDRIGTRSWLLAKARAARASARYAHELLEIQARRAAARGTAFPPDDEWQSELAASFPHVETPDQLEALAAVRGDMESNRPMERLVCGDVGYGKTEIALRAALKAVAGAKQVGFLVPTTILAYQHYSTFRARLSSLPVRVEMLSRLVAPAVRRQIAGDIAQGKVDIVIGTHVLLSTKVEFRDLGLFIVDEEQRFGVRQKEKIKQLRASVDLLTLTATPVPRTLYLALAGLRDISTVNTPPPGRREVETEVSVWNENLILAYVGREVARGGQVFFVHNRIASIAALAGRLRRLLPGLDVAVAHGQMPSSELEQIYLDFAAGQHQLLISTAIIESGLDLPNVNTIIVDRADAFGLADLHQLRGRVGRAGTRAYALFLIPPGQAVTGEARKRLSALAAYSRLGAGFKLALRDLEIRGAGDLLGTRQHGHVARVGLHLYSQLLREAAARLKGEQVQPEPELALDTDAFLPDEYVSDGYERVALYRRLLGLNSEAELDEFRSELVDRFGRYPSAVENLFKIARVRIHARRRGLLRVQLKSNRVTLVGPEQTTSFDGGVDELLAQLVRD